MKTIKELLEARFASSAGFKISASGRKVRRRIKIGDDDYNKEDDIDKDGDVDKDDAKLAKRLRWESFSSFAESKVPERMQGKQKPYVSSDGKGNYEVLGNKGQTKATFNRSEHGHLAHGKAQAHLRSKYDEYMKEETELEEKRGLWDNIHAKQERIKNGSGEKMRKPGSKGAPTATDFKNSQSESYAPVAPVPDKKYIKGTPEHKANKAAKKPINGHPTNVKEESIIEHDEHGPDHVEIALDHRTPPKNEKAAMATLKAHGAEYVATSDKATHFKVHKDKAYRLSKELKTHGVESDIMEGKEEDPPFDKPYKTVAPVTKDKSGAEHTGMSRARHIARLAMKQAAKQVKPTKA